MAIVLLRRFVVAGVLVLASGAALAQGGARDTGEIVIGQSGAFTGPVAAGPLEFRQGAQVFFDQQNAAGGINGRKVRLVSVDDALNPKKALENANEMLDKYPNLLAFFGFVGTGNAMAMIPLIEERQIPYFAPLTGATSVHAKKSPYVFLVRAGYLEEARSITQQLSTIGQNRIAALVLDDPLGKALLVDLQTAAKERGIVLAGTQVVGLTADSAVIGKAVDALAALQPDVIVLAGAGRPVVEFLRQAKAKGVTASFYSMSTLSIADISRSLGETARGVVVSQIVPSPLRLKVPIAKEFKAALAAADAAAKPTHRSLEGYIAAKVFSEAVRRAGTGVNRQSLARALEAMKNYDVGGMNLTFSRDNRAGSRYVDLVIISSGGNLVD